MAEYILFSSGRFYYSMYLIDRSVFITKTKLLVGNQLFIFNYFLQPDNIGRSEMVLYDFTSFRVEFDKNLILR